MANPKNLSPSEVAHVWAQGRETGGVAGGHRSAYFEGPILYSYGTHFVAGVRVRSPQEGDALAFVTAERNSKTTNERVGEAWSSVSHYPNRYRLPSIPRDIADTLAAVSRGETTYRAFDRETTAYVARPLRDRVAPFIQANALGFAGNGSPDAWAPRAGSDDARALGALVGMTPAAVDRLICKGLEKAKKTAEAEAKEAAALKLREARRVADMTAADWLEYRNGRGDGAANSYDMQEAQKRVKRVRVAYLAASQAAKAGKFSKVKLAKAKARLADLKAWADAMPERAASAARESLAAKAVAWLALTGPEDSDLPAAAALPQYARSAESRALFYDGRGSRSPQADALESFASDLAEQVAAAKRERQAAYHAARFEAWQASGLDRALRPDPSDYPEGSAARAGILADQADERAEAAALFEAWEADPSNPRPAARLFNYGGELYERFGAAAFNRLAEAERADKLAESWRAWRAGESHSAPSRAPADGSAYIRRSRDGERLETSQGATVPWDHALKAFRFLKLCRERGETFARNGRTIRVGHYQVDKIDVDGSFVAGCHRFAWSEIQALAEREGVFTLPASAAAVETSH